VVGTDGCTTLFMEYVIGFHMGIGKVTIAFVLINIIGFPIGKTYGWDPYQYRGTIVGGCFSSISVVVLKCFSTLGFIIDRLVDFTIIDTLHQNKASMTKT
jgi:hypothetical protein